MQAHNISIEQFVEARSIELTGFLNALTEKQTNKHCPQNVPKSVRRRAMSHNRYRIPRKLRLGLDNDLKVIESTQKIPVCRKRLRRKPRLLLSYNQRSDRTRWLPLHLWTAKRMKLVEYFGWKVADRPNDKAWRACYRFARYAACLVDLSYFHVLMLEGERSKHFLELYFKGSKGLLLSGDSYSEGWFIDQQQTQICPARIYSEKSNFIAIYHPAAQNEIEHIVQQCSDLKYKYAHGAFQIYQLIGPESLNKLKHALNNSNKLPLPRELEMCDIVKNPSCFHQNQVISFKWQITPGERMVSAPSVAYSEHLVQGYDAGHAQQLREQLNKLVTPTNDSHFLVEQQQFWKEGQEQHLNRPTITLKLTTRSKYTHKRSNKLKRNEKMSALEKIKTERETTPNKEVKLSLPETVLESKQHSKPKQILSLSVAMNNHTQLTDGCNVILASTDITLWRRLTYLNVKVIGRRDLVNIIFEAGKLSYPEDYPMTGGYNAYIKELRTRNITKFRKLPSNKRTNYDRLHSPFPFAPNFSMLCKNKPFNESFARLQLLMVGRGTPHKHCYLCLPTAEDIEAIRSIITSSANDSTQTIFSHVHTEPMEDLDEDADIEHIDLKNVKSMSDEQLERHFMGSRTSRRIVGFATSGGYSYARSKGFCNGYVLKQFHQMQYLLTRKPTSPFYFLAECQQPSEEY